METAGCLVLRPQQAKQMNAIKPDTLRAILLMNVLEIRLWPI